MYHALRIAWQHYYSLSQEQVLDKKRIQHYKRVIRVLQDKLRKPITEFIMFEAIVRGFTILIPNCLKKM
jgi:hypothetical protein